MLYRFIGDVHGKWNRYKQIIKDVDRSIVCGDFGCGFFKRDYEGVKIPTSNPPYDAIMKGNHKFIRGNHDNLSVCKKQSYWIPDGTIEQTDKHKIMYVGGALSVDKEWRTEGLDWWEDEELKYSELYNMTDLYAAEKPDVMITHDCPEFIALEMERMSGRRKLDINSRTRNTFQIMTAYHRPKYWLFGHWHYSMDIIIDGTRYICLNELEYIDLDL